MIMGRGKTFSEEEKKKVVWLKLQGHSYTNIAKSLDRESPESIANLFKRMVASGEFQQYQFELTGKMPREDEPKQTAAAEHPQERSGAVRIQDEPKTNAQKQFEFRIRLLKAVAEAALKEVSRYESD